MDTETRTNPQRKASRTKAATAWREGGLSVPLPNIGNVMAASFWFMPMVLVAVAVVSALGLVELEEVTDAPERRRLLVEQANHIAAAAERGVQAAVDREAIREQLQDVGARLRDAGMVEAIHSQPR